MQLMVFCKHLVRAPNFLKVLNVLGRSQNKNIFEL